MKRRAFALQKRRYGGGGIGIILTCDIGTTACAAFNVDGTNISDVRIEYTIECPRPG